MNKLSALLVCLLFSIPALAQNKASIKGIVVDSISSQPIEHATIAVVNIKDTSLIAYTLTQKDGSFHLSALPTNRDTKLIISVMGYNTFRQVLQLKPGALSDLGQLPIGTKTLKEVVVKAERSPVVVKKDTIEFNVEAFKVRPNAVVEDLLRVLPGVQVNYDGTILINGKEVSKLLIDGKRFFGNDPKVATKNLDADMLDKIQVYDDRDNDPDHKLSESEVSKVINLKMKSKIKKSTLGKVYAGTGTRGRHEIGGILSNFRDTLQVSLIGLSNNLNQTGFSTNELYTMGGFNRSNGSQWYDGTFGGRSWGGIQSITSTGLNINNDYGEKLRLNLTYFYTDTKTSNISKYHTDQTLLETILTSSSISNSQQNVQKHAISGAIDWKPDTIKHILYEPNVSFNPQMNTYGGTSGSFNTETPNLTSSYYNSRSKNDNNSFGQNFMFYHKLGHRGKSITVNHRLSLNQSTGDDFDYSTTTSYVSSLSSQLIDRYNDKGSKNNSAEISVNYNHPFTKKITATMFSNSRYYFTTNREFVYNKDNATGLYDLYYDTLSKNLTRKLFIQNLKPQLEYKINDKTTLRFALDLEIQHVTNKFNIDTAHDITKNYYLLLPSISLNSNGLSVDYSESFEQPSIDYMQPVTRVYSQLYKTIGNPGLQPSHNHDLRFNYYHYNYDRQRNTNFYTGITFTNNAVIYKTIIDSVGATTSTYVNRDNSLRIYFGGNWGKQFKSSQKWQIGLSNNFNGDLDRSAFFLNKDEGMQSRYYLKTTQNINFNYNSIISFNTNYALAASITNYQKVNYATVNSLTHTVGSDISVRWPAHIVFDAKYDYSYRTQVASGFPRSSNIVNMAVTLLMFKKDRGQLKLSVYDLLDQNISVYRYANSNSVTTGEQQVLKRYFLINYQFKISSYKSK